MTNTETPYISNFDKVSALVDVESAGFYAEEITGAVQAGLDEGFLTTWTLESGEVLVRLTNEGRERLAAFRAMLAPID